MLFFLSIFHENIGCSLCKNYPILRGLLGQVPIIFMEEKITWRPYINLLTNLGTQRNWSENFSEKRDGLTAGWQDNLQINIEMLFNMQNFISYDEFCNMFYGITEGKSPAESSYLRFKHDVLSNFGPVKKRKNIHPQ